MDIKEFENYKEKTIAEFKVAIYQAEQTIQNCIKNKNIKGTLEAYKCKIKLENLLHKKTKDGEKNNYSTHKRK